ncbi:penicillin acylase family protein [Roseococcus suduntuyensis]|uniref:Penicillin amidase n=1 Tax=Roseococcus suduntuyensis TaxID=455361 RepID=A0A840AGJ4_9PROT|nr:penicillin acylase family protein [Roseococcus suduntuyensis]MBB3900201.1 penicillin amidase [Roseococcus suduntuyensis]
MSIPTETLHLPGLPAEAEIIMDRWGIPHIRAATQEGAFFAQGFQAARDRLWQMDSWRKRGLGLLAGDLGAAYVERDAAARLLLYRGDMEAEWAEYGPEAKAWTTAFVAGINAYVDLVAREPARLPLEFHLLGTQPARWAPEDVVRCRTHARVRNLDAEVTRNNIAVRHGMEADRFYKLLQPDWTVIIPEGWLAEEVPPEVMRTYLLATDPAAIANGTPTDPVALDAQGSNNWALAPSRTTTGRAILASDPHRVHEQPSLRYITHLTAPGLDVIGAGEPAVPGVSLGHNDVLAFSLTIHPTDQEDLYVYELNADDPELYRYDGGWERMRVVEEEVPVRGEAPRRVTLRFTRHGPVLHRDLSRHRAWAVRSVWQLPGNAAYLASLNYLKARSFEDYTAALEGWGAPSSNHVVADVAGNIGWAAAGMVPVRTTSDGLLPVPGDGRHEWGGIMRSSGLPRATNPECGWLGTANQMNLPEGYDFATKRSGFEWTDGARYARLSEALEGDRRWSVQETLKLQSDTTCVPARRLCALLATLDDPHPAFALLTGWDHRLAAESGPAALFEIWFARHLVPGVMRTWAPDGVAAMVAVPDTQLVLHLLETDTARRDGLLRETLLAAWEDATKRLGDDPAAWQWGALHQGYFEHPLSRFAPALAAKLDVGPAPRGGSNLTINNNGWRASDFRVISGVSWRMVLDVGDWDRSFTINSPGQSGDPDSPHYRDLFPLWARDESVPLLFSREAVDAAAEARLLLRPAA